MSVYETRRDVIAEFDSVKERLADADDREPALDLARRFIRLAEQLVTAEPDDPDEHLHGSSWQVAVPLR